MKLLERCLGASSSRFRRGEQLGHVFVIAVAGLVDGSIEGIDYFRQTFVGGSQRLTSWFSNYIH
ncbi:MAG TPA: hypothetical protein VH392_05215 [Sphingomicrobium sp.]